MGSNQKPIHPHSAVADMWRKKPSSFYSCLEKIFKIYILPGGYKSMIRFALRSKLLLLSFFCLSLQLNKQFNQLSSTRMLQIFAYQHYLSPFFFIKIGIYHVVRQNCRVKHPGRMTAQIQPLAQQPKLWSLPLVLQICILPAVESPCWFSSIQNKSGCILLLLMKLLKYNLTKISPWHNKALTGLGNGENITNNCISEVTFAEFMLLCLRSIFK